MVGKSTLGRAATGNRPYAPMPNTSTPSINSEVAIGRRINGSEMLIGGCLRIWSKFGRSGQSPDGLSAGRARWPRSRWVDAGTIGQPILPVDHDAFAGRQPLGNDGDAVLRRSDINVAPLDRTIGLDDISIAAVRPVLDRLRRYRGDAASRRQVNRTMTNYPGYKRSSSLSNRAFRRIVPVDWSIALSIIVSLPSASRFLPSPL